MTHGNEEQPGRASRVTHADPLHVVRETLSTLRFGGILLTVHEGKLVQMEVTEKHRFT